MMYTNSNQILVLDNELKKCFVYKENLDMLQCVIFDASNILSGKTSIIGDRIFNSDHAELNIYDAFSRVIHKNVKSDLFFYDYF